MKLSQFKFKLPEEQIAQYPAHHRDESRLMVLHKKSGDIEHRQYFKDILDYFDDKDVFIFNDTKVFPAACGIVMGIVVFAISMGLEFEPPRAYHLRKSLQKCRDFFMPQDPGFVPLL